MLFQHVGFSVNVFMKLSGNFSSAAYAMFYIGFDFLLKYLLYFLRFIFPLSSKSVAAWLNISKDKGPVYMSVEFNFSDESNQRGIFVVVEGFSVAIWSHGTNTGGRISSSGGVCDS